MWTQACVCTRGGQRKTLDVQFPYSPPYSLETETCPDPGQGSPPSVNLGWLTIYVPISISPSSSIFHGCWRLRSGHHACGASTFTPLIHLSSILFLEDMAYHWHGAGLVDEEINWSSSPRDSPSLLPRHWDCKYGIMNSPTLHFYIDFGEQIGSQ